MRWNLVKLRRTWDTKISSFVAKSNTQKADLMAVHKQKMLKRQKHVRQSYEKAKEAVPLNKRLVQMAKSYENLRHANQMNRAAR